MHVNKSHAFENLFLRIFYSTDTFVISVTLQMKQRLETVAKSAEYGTSWHDLKSTRAF